MSPLVKPQLNLRDYVRIMVVDDEDDLRDIICDTIDYIGIRHVHQANDGLEALVKSEEIRPDLVFCDIQMEQMSGLEYLKTLRQARDPLVADIPVVFLTGTTDEQTVLDAKKYGANGFLSKPPRGSAIKDAINRLLPDVLD